jgi:hypothetical protein
MEIFSTFVRLDMLYLAEENAVFWYISPFFRICYYWFPNWRG